MSGLGRYANFDGEMRFIAGVAAFFVALFIGRMLRKSYKASSNK